MTNKISSKTSDQDKFSYDYANKCDCSDDDKCGCSFPNNLSHDFDDHCAQNQEKNCPTSIHLKKVEINTPNTHLEKESICVCSPSQCDCTITRNEKNK